LVAAIVAWIAYQQFRLAREKFKLDLFEKRFAVYSAARKLLSIIAQKANIENKDLFEFLRDTHDSYFETRRDEQRSDPVRIKWIARGHGVFPCWPSFPPTARVVGEYSRIVKYHDIPAAFKNQSGPSAELQLAATRDGDRRIWAVPRLRYRNMSNVSWASM
jgi:hypothetical protein